MRRIAYLLLPLALFASACATQTASSVQTVSANEIADVVARPGVVTIDVRTPQEFASGHLEGAINIDLQAADFKDRISALPTDGTYAVYCQSGNRSATAVAQMAKMGFGDIYEMSGGIMAWQLEGLPIVH